MMWLADLFTILGMPQFVSTPVYFDAGLLALAAFIVWLIADLIIEELDHRRMERSEQLLKALVRLLERS